MASSGPWAWMSVRQDGLTTVSTLATAAGTPSAAFSIVASDRRLAACSAAATWLAAGTVRQLVVSGDGRWAVAANEDGVLHWYRMRDGREVLQELFFQIFTSQMNLLKEPDAAPKKQAP